MKLDAGDVPAPVGRGRPALLLGHDAPPRGEPRLRLADPQHLRRHGDRARSRSFARRTITSVAARARARVLRSRPRVALLVSVAAARRRRARPRRAARRAPGAGRGDDRPRPTTNADASAAARSSRPCSISSRRSSRSSGLLAAAEFAGGPYALAAARLARRRRVPRLGDRRDAARPLVSRAAGPAARRRSRSSCVWTGGRVAVRGRGVPVADGHGPGAQRHGRRRLQRPARLDLGRVRGHDDRPRRDDVVRAAGAVLLRGDGRDRPAVPRDPHRFGTDLIARAVLS